MKLSTQTSLRPYTWDHRPLRLISNFMGVFGIPSHCKIRGIDPFKQSCFAIWVLCKKSDLFLLKNGTRAFWKRAMKKLSSTNIFLCKNVQGTRSTGQFLPKIHPLFVKLGKLGIFSIFHIFFLGKRGRKFLQKKFSCTFFRAFKNL